MKPKNIPIKKIIKAESLFLKSFGLLKSNPNKAGLMVLFDVLFLVSFFGLQTLSLYYAKNLALPTDLSSAIVFIAFSLIYYLIALFAYSFFKYSIMDFIKSLFENKEFSFKRLGSFYSLNILIVGIFFAIMLVFNFILASVKLPYQPFVFTFLAVPYSLFLYVITNIAHSSFYQGASIKDSIKKGFRITFKKIKSYKEIILTIILAALLLWLLFFGSGYLLKLLTSKNYNLYLNTYAYFTEASKWLSTIVFYLIIFINRISFYAIVKEDK